MSDFKDINYRPLQVYNRCVMFFNIMEDAGEEPALEYLSQFSNQERSDMLDMYRIVKKHGVEWVKKQLTRNMPLEPEEEEVFV